MQLAFWQKLCQKEPQATGSLLTPERKVPKRSDASQNEHKSKGYPSKTEEAAFTMQKAEKGGKGGFGYMQLAFWLSKKDTRNPMCPRMAFHSLYEQKRHRHFFVICGGPN